jgi:hypothetical protein
MVVAERVPHGDSDTASPAEVGAQLRHARAAGVQLLPVPLDSPLGPHGK